MDDGIVLIGTFGRIESRAYTRQRTAARATISIAFACLLFLRSAVHKITIVNGSSVVGKSAVKISGRRFPR
jgi:hypothetical protein